MLKFILKPTVLFTLILLLAGILRLYSLGSVPSGMTNDEASYVYNAHSIWHTGKDITGKFLPISINLDNSFSPVPIYLNAPIVGILGISPMTGRLLFALTGIATVAILYFLNRRLFKNEFIALSSMLVLAVSPWHVHFSRTTYDGILALFFCLLGTYIFIHFVEKGRAYLSLPFFFLAFYSYHAIKVFIVCLIPILVIFWAKDLLKNKTSSIIFVIGVFLILASFLWVQKTQDVTRSHVLLQYNSKEAATMVDIERKNNDAPFFIRQVFNNKIKIGRAHV